MVMSWQMIWTEEIGMIVEAGNSKYCAYKHYQSYRTEDQSSWLSKSRHSESNRVSCFQYLLMPSVAELVLLWSKGGRCGVLLMMMSMSEVR